MDEAVQLADDAVFEAQAGGSVVDMSRMMRDPGMMRLLTVFMTFTANQYNKNSYYWRGLKSWFRDSASSDIGPKEFATAMATQVVMSASLVAILFSLAQEGEMPEAEEYAWETLGLIIGGHPILRMIPSMLRYNSKAGETAGMRGMQSAVDAIRIGAGLMIGDKRGDEWWNKFVRQTVNSAAFAAGCPRRNCGVPLTVLRHSTRALAAR